MKLEQQVASLDLAKRLKELGVKQESHFYWRKLTEDDGWEVWDSTGLYGKTCSAFTVAELGEMLPKGYAVFSVNLDWPLYKPGMEWCCESGDLERNQFAPTEADARAKMLIYLIENGLVKTDSITSSIGITGRAVVSWTREEAA
jgi:hypothetical protein